MGQFKVYETSRAIFSTWKVTPIYTCLSVFKSDFFSIKAYLTSTQQTTTAQAQSSTCGPVRCLSPCNKGIVIAADGCPKCVC